VLRFEPRSAFHRRAIAVATFDGEDRRHRGAAAA
jgi:hypothetical protein